MTNKEILDLLAETESKLFYAYIRTKTDESKFAHDRIVNTLVSFKRMIEQEA